MSGYGITGFGSDNSSSSSLDFVRDAFPDVTVAPDSNSGLTSNSNTNPLSQYFANDAAPRFGAKVLFIKSIDLIEDRSKWINNTPTFNITWTEPFPSVKGYCFGSASLYKTRNYTGIKFPASDATQGFGVGGVIRKVKWLTGANGGTAINELVDASVVGTFSTNQYPLFDLIGTTNEVPIIPYSPASSITSSQTLDLHDFRITSTSSTCTLRPFGVIVYFENGSNNVQTVSGDVYYDKTKISVVGSSLSIPAATTRGGAVGIGILPNSTFSTVQSTLTDNPSACNGLINTNLVNVSAGTGAFFPPGTFIWAKQGSSHYIGNVLSRSTDVLTMGVTLPFALSGTTAVPILYAGVTFTTSSYSLEEAWTYRPSDFGPLYNTALYARSGTSGALNSFFDSSPSLDYRVWGASCFMKNTDGATFEILVQNGSLFQVDGQFSALEIEFHVSSGIAGIGCTFIVNGIPAFHLHESPGAGYHRRLVMTGAANGFNTVRIQPGASMLNTTISSVTGYKSIIPGFSGSGYGLGGVLQGQTFLQRDAQSASFGAFGPIQRVYADQIPTSTGWGSTFIGSGAGGLRIECSDNTDTGTLNFYGLAFSFVGTKGATFTCLFDGIAQNFSFGQWVGLGSSTAFHTLTFQGENGQTTIIQAIDILNPSYEMVNTQKFTNPYYEPDAETFKVSNGTLKIKDGGIQRSKLDPYAAVFSSYFGHTFFGASLGQTSLESSQVAITTHGGPVMLWVESLASDPNPAVITNAAAGAAANADFSIRLNRDNNDATGRVQNFRGGVTDAAASGLSFYDGWPMMLDPNPPAGIHYYTLGLLKSGQSLILTGNGRLFARELF